MSAPGLGLDHGLALDWDDHRRLAAIAAERGYGSLWTPAGIARDAFTVCCHWFAACGLRTGISVVPAPLWSPPVLASVAATVFNLTGGKFVLGVGMGSYYSPDYRRQFGLADHPPVAFMRAYLIALRRLLAGEKVEMEGAVTLRGVQLGIAAPDLRIYLAALGPQMLRLGGELADGVALNWCTPEMVAWSRERIAEGARRAGRDPVEVALHEYVRVAVSDDPDAARRAIARAVLPYALGEPGLPPTAAYRGHFARLGFEPALARLEEMRARGENGEAMLDALPEELLRAVASYGTPSEAAAGFQRLAEGVDEPVVRVVAAGPVPAAVEAVLEACAPIQP
jgi:alkanesulfonate monooxygenase SsuD/methylene tetrahydromethanopterin reductase-like flavin-dependent oxidoreductase (luciferase family)